MSAPPHADALEREHRRASVALVAVDALVADLSRACGAAAAPPPTEDDDDDVLASVVLELRHEEALHRAALEVTDRLLPSSLVALIR